MWSETRLRILRMFFVAALMALALILFAGSDTKGQECEEDPDDPESSCFAVYWPGMCSYMEPYSYWWYYWNCGAADAAMTAETVEVEPISERYQRVTIHRQYTDRPDEVLERIVPRRRQR